MAAPSCARSTSGILKRLQISVPSATSSRRWASTSLANEIWATDKGIDIKEVAEKRGIKLPQTTTPLSPEDQTALAGVRVPRNIGATRLRPLRRAAQYGMPVCDLQLRTYSVRNMDLFADFAMRAAYYLGLVAKGPIPLPRITERWTVPRANFVFKKSQENFERITMRRLIQIQDGHPETVRLWLGILQKYQYHGVGMKANVWEYESLAATSQLDSQLANSKPDLEKVWKGFGTRKESVLGQKVQEILARPEYGGALEVSKRMDEAQTASMNAADEVRKSEDRRIEEEEFDKAFVKLFGPAKLKEARGFIGKDVQGKNAEEKKAEVERMNRIMAEFDGLEEHELGRYQKKWDALAEESAEDKIYASLTDEEITAKLKSIRPDFENLSNKEQEAAFAELAVEKRSGRKSSE